MRRILLDHCVPKAFGKLLVGHEVKTTRQMGWDRLVNGELLREASVAFDVLVTVDGNMRYQQSQSRLPIAVVVLRPYRNSCDQLSDLVAEVLSVLKSFEPMRLYEVEPRTAQVSGKS